MRVNLKLFALARDRANTGLLTFDIPEPATVGGLRHALSAACPSLAPLVPSLMIAVNNDYADDSHPIAANDELAAIPPVSGGAES